MFVATQLQGQKKFNLQVKGIQIDLNGKMLTGYSSEFDFSREEVRMGWWKYARTFGNPLDMRTYYQVKIPSETTDGNVDLTMYALTIEENGIVNFKLGIEDKKYKVQVEEMMKVFKKDFYIQFYIDELKIIELEAEDLSNKYERAIDEEKDEILNSLNIKKLEMERLKVEIRKVEEE